MFIDFAVSGDRNVIKKESGRIAKYENILQLKNSARGI